MTIGDPGEDRFESRLVRQGDGRPEDFFRRVLEWVAGDLCTHYWLQRIEITRVLKFAAVTPLPGGVIQLTLTGEPGHTNAIEVSTNLVDWTWHTNLFNPKGTVQWDDTPPAGSTRQFYRALAL